VETFDRDGGLKRPLAESVAAGNSGKASRSPTHRSGRSGRSGSVRSARSGAEEVADDDGAGVDTLLSWADGLEDVDLDASMSFDAFADNMRL
jgi:hypothetical protein